MRRSDSKLVLRIQTGDKDAFAELYRSYFPKLCDFIHQYVDMPAVCEELVQDLFLNIWRRRNEWNPKGTPRSYLYKAARNRALDHLKHLEVEKDYLNHHKIEKEQEWELIKTRQSLLLVHEAHPSTDTEGLIEAVDEAIRQLPDSRRLIFLMSREDGLTYREIAEILDISVKTVETQMGRSLKALRSMLSDFMPGILLLSLSGCFYSLL